MKIALIYLWGFIIGQLAIKAHTTVSTIIILVIGGAGVGILRATEKAKP